MSASQDDRFAARFTPLPGERKAHHYHKLGEGILNWNRGERMTDRYGAITLSPTADSEESAFDVSQFFLQGRKGKLVATVLGVNASGHIGDLFRGFRPGGAEVGMQIVLGHGTLFVAVDEGVTTVGLRPDDYTKQTDWLDPAALYKAHEQLVWLDFIEDAQ